MLRNSFPKLLYASKLPFKYKFCNFVLQPFERKKSLRRRRVRNDTGGAEIEPKSRDVSPAARSSDNEADVSGESTNNSLERPSSRPVSLSNLHGLQEVSGATVAARAC